MFKIIKRIAKLSFTGSTETGRKVLHNAAENIIPVTMELGGKSPLSGLTQKLIDKIKNKFRGKKFFLRFNQRFYKSSYTL